MPEDHICYQLVLLKSVQVNFLKYYIKVEENCFAAGQYWGETDENSCLMSYFLLKKIRVTTTEAAVAERKKWVHSIWKVLEKHNSLEKMICWYFKILIMYNSVPFLKGFWSNIQNVFLRLLPSLGVTASECHMKDLVIILQTQPGLKPTPSGLQNHSNDHQPNVFYWFICPCHGKEKKWNFKISQIWFWYPEKAVTKSNILLHNCFRKYLANPLWDWLTTDQNIIFPQFY